jgi:hypothetical protein
MRAILAFTMVLAIAGPVRAITMDVHDVTLSLSDQNQLASVACGVSDARELRGISAFTGSDEKEDVSAFVNCSPHGVEESVPVFYRVYCDKLKGTWLCTERRSVFLVAMPDGSHVEVVPDGISRRAAIGMFLEAAALKTPKAHPVSTFLAGACYVEIEGPPAIKNTTHFQIECDHVDNSISDVYFTKDCWEDSCKVHIQRAGNQP